MVLYGCETLTVTLKEEHRLRTTCYCLHCYYCYHCCTENFHMDRFCYVYIPSHIYQTHIFCLYRLFNSLLDCCVLMVQQKQNSQCYFLSIWITRRLKGFNTKHFLIQRCIQCHLITQFSASNSNKQNFQTVLNDLLKLHTAVFNNNEITQMLKCQMAKK
jgi:hypothetical protein